MHKSWRERWDLMLETIPLIWGKDQARRGLSLKGKVKL
jgi:hypothetical protein